MTDHPDLRGWLHPSLYVGGSLIDGTGLFTREGLASGSLIVRFGGYLYSSASRYDFDRIARDTVVGVSDETLLAEPRGVAPDYSDRINHSCDPNVGMLDAVSLVTVRAVPPDSELTCDYAYWEVDPGYVMRKPCNCQSPACRGRVTGGDWMRSDLRDRVRKWAAPFIRRRIADIENVESEYSDGSGSGG